MARRETAADVLITLPWWVLVLLSGVAYVLCDQVLPSLEIENWVLMAIFDALQPMAWLISCALLLFAAFSGIRSVQRRRLVAKQESLASIRALSWRDFEHMAAEIFKQRGFTVLKGPTDGADGGVDIALRKEGALALVQCKQWRSKKIGVKVVRELYGVMSLKGADHGFVVCSGEFTPDANAFARESGVELINGASLLVLAEQCQRVTPSHVSAANDESCPVCQGEMVLRSAKRGKNAGNNFFGCARFPKCRGVRTA